MPTKFQLLHRFSCARIQQSLTLAAILSASSAFAGYEAPTSTFGVGNYYSSITAGLTGNALRLQLHTITSTGFTSISYGDSREDLPIVWTDPANPLNMILIYDHSSIVKPTGGSIPGWEYSNNVLVWNREHLWPQSWLGVSVDNSYSGPASDLFELAPADPSTNGGRGNDGYGNVTSSGAPGVNGSYFFPGDADKGDAARSIFYMATRYYTGNATLSIQNLQLVNGSSYTTFEMGDLQSLLHYNYEDGVDNFERQRNETIQSLQGDRNPFIDHPEYVWAIFGVDANGNHINNSSQISVGTPNADGSSSAAVSLGRIMLNGSFATANTTVNKTGATPTTFDITGSGNAATTLGNTTTTLGIGTGQPFDYGNVTKTMTVGLNASTSSAGLKSGAITIHNTDLSTAGAGEGSADGDDTVNISGAVLAKRVITASQSAFPFGTVITGATVSSAFNLTTTGDDNSATRVNVAGSTSADANGISITGAAALFNSAASTSSRTITGTLTAIGDTSGSLSLPITTAENNGAGLTGEGTYTSLATTYTAKVLAHSNGSFNPTVDTDSLTLNFGLRAQNSGTISLPFSISDLVATPNYTAGLDLDSINITGSSSAFTTNLAIFSNESAGTSNAYNASIDTTTGGSYDATYTLNVSDQNLPGATTNNALTLHLIGTVSQSQTVATLSGNATTTLDATTLIVTSGGNFSGILQDGTYPGFLVLTGGTLTLSGNNTYSGSTTASNNSTLSISSDANLGSALTPVTLDGSTFQVTGTDQPTTSRQFTIASGGGTFDITDAGNTLTITSAIITNGPLTKTGPGNLVLAQNFTTTFPTTLSQGTFELDGPANTATTFTGNGILKLVGSLQLSHAVPSTASQISTLILAGSSGAWTGGLDLTNNKLIVEDSTTHAATVAAIKDQVAYGTTHTAGIYSSTLDANHTVAVVDNAIANLTSVGGITTIDSGSIIVATALIGDADLSGTVDILDLTIVANHWQQPVSDWSQGDFNGSGLVDILDLTAVANHWQASDNVSPQFAAVLPTLKFAAPVPEPTTLCALLLAVPLLARRRRPF